MHLSHVQEYSLQLLMACEAREKEQNFSDQIKLALVTYNPTKFIRLVAPNAQVDEPEIVDEDVDLDDTAGEWQFTDTVAPEEAEEVLRQMLHNPVGEITTTDVDNNWM